MDARTLSLCLHCGGQEVDYEQVKAVHTPPPSGTHYPIPHQAYVEHVLGSMERVGLEVARSVHALAGSQQERYFGLFELTKQTEDYAVVIGLRNSHDKSVAAKLGAGNRVFVCDNLAFSAEVVVGRKHTSRIMQDLTRLVDEAMGKMGSMLISMERRVEAYKVAQLPIEQVDHLVVEMMRAKVLASSQIRKVVEEYEEPSHQEFLEHGESGWRLFNATTEVLKGTNVFDLPQRTTRLQGLLDQACGVSLAEAA